VASPSEHALVVLSAIIPDRRDLLERAMSYLTPEHFPEPQQANLFKFLIHYSDRTGGAIIPLQYLSDNLRDRLDAGKALQYEELWSLAAETETTDDAFAWSMEQLRIIAAENATAELFTESMEILRQGRMDGSTLLKGADAARQYVLEGIQEIDRELTRHASPEGDMRTEYAELVGSYAEAKERRKNGTAGGVRTGVEEIDRKLAGGIQRGEFLLAVGYSSDGKSSFCVQTAWSAAVEQGKNVVFLTTETHRETTRNRLFARHSRLPQFGLPEGLNTKDLKAGTLSDEDEKVMKLVARDFTKNPEYGHLLISQVPPNATVMSLDQRLHRIQRQFDIDLVVMDYLALLTSGLRRASLREDMAQILKDAKVLAVTFNNGRGVPFMSPWQVTRAAREQAETDGQYSTRGLSETAEATNSPDIILGLLAPTDNTSRYADVMFQVMKNRDGETANGIMVEADYATCMFRSRSVPGLDDFRQRGGDSRVDIFSDSNYGDLLGG
jgi:replicative DNA helicase